MNAEFIKKIKMSKVGGAVKVAMYHLKKVRPEIFLGVGVVGVAAGTIMACKKMKDAQPIIDHTREQLEELKFVRENAIAEEKPGFKEYAKVLVRSGYELGKTFALPGTVWVGGMACIFGSHGDLRSQNGKLLAQGVALKKFIDEYRERVAGKIGAEEEKMLYFGAENRPVEYEETDPETGEVTKKTSEGKVFVKNPGSIWARNFTKETSDEFSVRSRAGIDMFLDAKEENLTTELRFVPFIVINEVYDAIGLKPGKGKCAEGMTTGWVQGEKIIIERLEGWEEVWDPVRERFVMKKCLRLDFNCHPLDGLI